MKPAPIAIITDSTCDIPDTLLEKHRIIMVPQTLIWGEKVFLDRVQMRAKYFYQRLRDDPTLPTTSTPEPIIIQTALQNAVEEGAEAIVVIMISRALSGTLDLTKSLAEACPVPVHFVDAKGPTMSLGWQVLAAARARNAGAGVDAMLKAADQARASMVQLVSLETMEYLHKGGRIGHAQRLLGALLKVKPLVEIDHDKGIVEALATVRTRKHALERLYHTFFERLGQTGRQRIAVLHGDALEEAQMLIDRIQAEKDPAELLLTTTSPVLGVHTGPGAIALCGYCENA